MVTPRIDPDLVEDVDEAAAPPAVEAQAILPSGPGPVEDGLILTFDDLIVDDDREVLVDAQAAPVSLVTGSLVVGEGIAEGHMTAAGVDVSGLTYVTLENGVTIYYSGHVDFL